MRRTQIVTEANRTLLKLLGRHSGLERVLRHARVVPAAKVPADVVTMNSRVTYIDEASGVRTAVKLAYPQDAAGGGHVDVTSPLGNALLGAREGQEIECHLGTGSRRRLRVERVLFQPERRWMRIDQRLDEALMQTFPASDAFVVSWEPRVLD